MQPPWHPETVRRLVAAHTPRTQPAAGRIPAAVLVPLLWPRGRLSLLFIRRTHTLSDHPGQIAFPGGRIEPADPAPAAAALREAHEEIGLPPERVELIGRLDDHPTRTTKYHLTPVVGIVTRPPAFAPDPREVAEVFMVPFEHLSDPANQVTHRVEHQSREVVTPGYRWHGDVIWGATATILQNLIEVLRPGR